MLLVKHVRTKFCLADIFTKATDEATLKTLGSVMRNDMRDGFGLRAMRIAQSVLRMVGGA